MSVKVICNGTIGLSRKLKKSEADKFAKAVARPEGEGPVPYTYTYVRVREHAVSNPGPVPYTYTYEGREVSIIRLNDYEGSYGNYKYPDAALNAGLEYLESIGVSVDPAGHITTIDDYGDVNIVYLDTVKGKFAVDSMEYLAVQCITGKLKRAARAKARASAKKRKA